MTEDAIQPPREEFTDINVDSKGDWFTKDRLITNEKVLAYFKDNLHYDEKGLYIFNRFGRFSEKGYIKVNGPVLKVIRVYEEIFLLENGLQVPIKDVRLVFNAELHPYLYLSSFKAWASFSRQGYLQLGDHIKEIDDNFFFENKALEIVNSIDWASGL